MQEDKNKPENADELLSEDNATRDMDAGSMNHGAIGGSMGEMEGGTPKSHDEMVKDAGNKGEQETAKDQQNNNG